MAPSLLTSQLTSALSIYVRVAHLLSWRPLASTTNLIGRLVDWSDANRRGI